MHTIYSSFCIYVFASPYFPFDGLRKNIEIGFIVTGSLPIYSQWLRKVTVRLPESAGRFSWGAIS